MLEVRNVTRVFGNKIAVDRVSFSIDRPAFVGIIGRSGAGKSTFLRMMNRLTDATDGEILVDGTNVLTYRGADARAWQSRCAMIFQQFNLVPRLDVVSNVLHGKLNQASTLATMFNLWSKADISRAIDILDRLGIAEQAPKRAEALSGGQQQRVAIARAVIGRPDMLVADEPTGNVDPEMAVKLLRLFEALNRLGTTVVVATHDVHLIRQVPESLIMRLDKGRLSDPTGALRYPPRRAAVPPRPDVLGA